jgi:soluble lytic murein transglycosylase-like protein
MKIYAIAVAVMLCIGAAIFGVTAQARCGDRSCHMWQATNFTSKQSLNNTSGQIVRKLKTERRARKALKRRVQTAKRYKVKTNIASRQNKKKVYASKRVKSNIQASRKHKIYASRKYKKYAAKQKKTRTAHAHPTKGSRGRVVAIIKTMAPRFGVPTWFALRIAKIESGFNPRVRGAAGEIGVYQMKCSTARHIGFRGSCRALYNASTNVYWGLRHLSMAVKSSRGNLRLAASKHNGGLGRRTIVRRYVSLVF